MRMPNEMVLWKRVLAFLGFTLLSIFLIYQALHSITLDCEPASGCVHRQHRAWMTTDETRFQAPPAERVEVHRHGKGGNLGDVEITTETGAEVELTWMSHDEAKAAAAELVGETAAGRPFHVETHGPRWWLLFLLLTVPVAASFVLPQRIDVPTVHHLPPPVQDKKRRRAERKARAHDKSRLRR